MSLYFAYAAPLLAGLLLAIGILWIKAPFFVLAKRSVSLLDLLVSDLDEDAKFEAVNGQVFKTVGSLLHVLGKLVFVVLIAVALASLLPEFLELPTIGSTTAAILLGVGSLPPFLIPKKKTSDYSPMAQLFHHLVLDNYHLGRKLLQRQIKGVSSPIKSTTSRVLITGLARAGTTALTKEVEKRGPFASLDYSNMPLLLAPKLWSKIYKPKREENKERAHGDGVKVGLASVEALEEYFFKVLKDDSYISSDGIHEHTISEEENMLYRRYADSICKPGEIYLAKNNNAITRLESLLALNPDLKVIVLLRNPLQHAKSLLHQHLKFTAEQEQDPFVLTYMDWLGHHEFGKGQRPFSLVGSHFTDVSKKIEHIDYWVERWIDYHLRLKNLSGVSLIHYEAFVKNPKRTLEAVSKATSIALDLEEVSVFSKVEKPVEGVSKELEQEALQIYNTLLKQCQNVY